MHKVRKHSWLNGLLHIEEEFFESIEDAISYVNSTSHHGAKITNEHGNVVHQVGAVEPDTYA